MNHQKTLIYTVLGIIVLGGIFSLIFTSQYITNKPTDSDNGTAAKPLSDITGENVTFTITEKEHKKWELRVKETVYYKDQSGANLIGITGEFYNDKGEPVVSFTAPKGSYVDENKAIVLTDGVTVSSIDENGSSLKAPSITWSTQKDLVYAKGGVELNMGGYALAHAERCEFALDFSTVALLGQARSEIDF